MGDYIVIDGNAFYEVDEECMKKKNREQTPDKRWKGEKKNKNEERISDRKRTGG